MVTSGEMILAADLPTHRTMNRIHLQKKKVNMTASYKQLGYVTATTVPHKIYHMNFSLPARPLSNPLICLVLCAYIWDRWPHL